MLTLAVVLTVVGWLVAFVAGPLVLVDWIHARRRETIARQIAVTDAIHGELGAVVAPVVTRRLGGAWEVRIPVPFDRPALVERVLAIAHRTLA
ncbi:MAG: hypothetical protein HYS77_03270, partial [Candidatus Rokubacteria bacterium]|nr:hypothetical protein [Candidatus Rokubacteria bacterium]